MIISVASGKGGTGKTTVAVNLALSLENAQLLDCDVEEPNAHIFLTPDIRERKPCFVSVPEIDQKKCNFCRKCSKACEFNAIAVLEDNVLIFPELCHSCGLCALVCPKKAITEKKRRIGVVEKGSSNGIEFVQGILNIGEAMSTPLISAVKEEIDKNKIAIVDVPPGTSCPVIEAVHGSDYCILVTEPTPFGLYDLKIAIGVLEKLKIRKGVIINQDGIGDQEVEEFCKKNGIQILLRIPYDRKIAELYSKGIPFIQEMPEWKEKFKEVFEKIKKDR
ncbi:MAG: ATP-binding protein [Candidatus Altiarchaeota archaeon]|nr:ATP-binding protein [Candidatus Altiarchaeota archaeon]